MADILVYFHGLGSSPNSSKVQELRKIFPRVYAPKVGYKYSDVGILIKDVHDCLMEGLDIDDWIFFVGTSLGVT